jgi:dipeptidyl-peptidase-4
MNYYTIFIALIVMQTSFLAQTADTSKFKTNLKKSVKIESPIPTKIQPKNKDLNTISKTNPSKLVSKTSNNKKITNKDIWASGTFSAKNVYGVTSMNDGVNFTTLEQGKGGSAIKKARYDNPTSKSTLVSSSIFKSIGKPELSIEDYQFNPTESKVLIATEQESIYRHSSKSNYYIYDLTSQKLTPLSDFSKGKQSLAEFSPTEDKVAFTRNNNLFVKDFKTNKEAQITTDGKYNAIINGGTDWVYEEEFGFDKGFEWSPDGSKIAYYRFDESEVKEYQMEIYGTLYPSHQKFKYPKAGEQNSLVTISVYELSSGRTTPFYNGSETDIYIPRIEWASNNTLSVQKLNRLQNELEIWMGTFEMTRPNNKSVQTKVVYAEVSKTYIDIHDNTTFLKDGKSFLWTSEKDGYNHIYKINYINGKEEQITKGEWEVTSVYGINEKLNTIYFQAAHKTPMQREVYSINVKSKEEKLLSKLDGTNDAEFSNTFDYYILHHSDANTPFTVTVHNTLSKANVAPIVLVDNKELKERLTTFDLTKKTFFKVNNAEGTALNAWMIKPSNFDEQKEYPLLMFVYGGPGINTVNDAWSYGNYFWFQSLAEKGYIVVSVDARGTGYRGKDFKHSTYLQLGKYETEDQIAAAKELGAMSYIDKNRIGIFGWSYGGYMSSLCITKGADVFKAAIAVAPVTNWRYYDNIYTERFMRTPQENGKNYDVNSPINHVDKLKGNYLLIHGSADDNVHFQNAMEMNSALVNKNKAFDFMAYPNKNHGIYGGLTRLHLYNKMTNFLLEKL